MQVMLCQSDPILLHKWGLDDSQSYTTVYTELLLIYANSDLSIFIRQLHNFHTYNTLVRNLNPRLPQFLSILEGSITYI